MKETAVRTITITSEAFENNGYIPSKYTCEGLNISPPLRIQGIPENTKSLAIIVDDPDAPDGVFTHWTAWNIPVKSEIVEDAAAVGTEGFNNFGIPKYLGPCPPSGTHRYFFKIYALDSDLEIDLMAGKEALETAMTDHIIAYGELVGLYQKKKNSAT